MCNNTGIYFSISLIFDNSTLVNIAFMLILQININLSPTYCNHSS